MGIFDRISRIFSSSGNLDEAGYWVYVRCNRCGEKLSSRVNIYNDLSVDFNESGEQNYHCRKTIVGRQACFERIEIKLTFDKRRKLKEQEISGGEFITEEDFTSGDI